MRAYNFSPGPSALPLSVLQKIQAELLEYPKIQASILEVSHRSPAVRRILKNVTQKLASLLRLKRYSKTYHLLFTTGGASSEFYRIPMNLLGEGETADYLETGIWAAKAINEAKLLGKVKVAASSAHAAYSYIPKTATASSAAEQQTIRFSKNPRYVYLCANNTVYGTQYHTFPQPPTPQIPLVADCCSEILTREIDLSPFGVLFAGLQKNLGPAGLNVVLVRDDVLQQCRTSLPTLCSYKKMLQDENLSNTPPVFQLYALEYVLDWMSEVGGVGELEKQNRKKAALLYETLDAHDLFLTNAAPADRSLINVTWQLPTPDLEEKFLRLAQEKHLINLKGHRLTGGIRASLYNAISLTAVEKLAAFMHSFARSYS